MKSEAPRGEPQGIFAEPCEANDAIPPCGKPQGFLAKKGEMIRFKEIAAGIKSCFSLTAHERLIIILVLALFLFGLGLRWRHLSREHADPDLNESRDESRPEKNASPK